MANLFKQVPANRRTAPLSSIRGGAEYLFRYIPPPHYCLTCDSVPYTPVHRTIRVRMSHTGRPNRSRQVNPVRHYTCWISAKMWAKMPRRAFEVLLVLLGAVVVSSNLSIGNIECGEKFCKPYEYCSPELFCHPCAFICDSTSHNFDKQICEKKCQSESLRSSFAKLRNKPHAPANKYVVVYCYICWNKTSPFFQKEIVARSLLKQERCFQKQFGLCSGEIINSKPTWNRLYNKATGALSLEGNIL